MVRFGRRRRRCVQCGHTWRVWQRRRGRKVKRSDIGYCLRYLTHATPPVRVSSVRRGIPRTTAQRRLERSRDSFLARTPWPALAGGSLIAVADAWMQYVERSWYAWYIILLRPVAGTNAAITPLYHHEGRESVMGWQSAFDQLPKDVLSRIIALVCDGHRGLVGEAYWRNWHLQRCQFHLIAAIQGRRSRWGASRHRAEGERLSGLVSLILTAPQSDIVREAVNELEALGWQTRSPQLKRILQGFINHSDDYRTYLRHPELNLPRTSNAAEVFFSLVEEICHRARGFRTVRSLDRWIEAVAKHRQHITCNGASQPN